MLIETFPQGARVIEGTPNIVVSIRPGLDVTLQLMADEQKHCYTHVRLLTRGQDPAPVARQMFDSVLLRLNRTTGAD